LQGKLPLAGGDARPRAKGTDLKLTQVLARLDVPEVDPEEQQWAVARLAGEYGPAFKPFYWKVVEAVRQGREPLGKLMEAVEEAGRHGVKDRGRAFTAACKRTMSSLASRTPGPGPNRQAHPGPGGSPCASNTNQLSKIVG
jgi:hypothetical protein